MPWPMASVAPASSLSIATRSGRSSTTRPSNRFTEPTKSAMKRLAGNSYSSCGWPIWAILPLRMTAMRLAIVIASSWSCVTMTKVVPTCFWMRISSNWVCSRSLRSSAESGSSSSSTFGRLASARASATRCRWPPESWCGLRRAKGPSCTRSSTSPTRRLRSRPEMPSRRRPNATLSATDMCGNSA